MSWRRGPVTRRRLAGFLQQLPIGIYDETASRIWTSTTQLAEQHRLTAHDACHLESALRLDLPLATGDKQLMAAARASGVPLLLAG